MNSFIEFMEKVNREKQFTFFIEFKKLIAISFEEIRKIRIVKVNKLCQQINYV